MKPIVFGKYTLIERLGTGGMAEVFLAKTAGGKGLERLVAIKRIHSHMAADRKFTSMFIDEANLAAKLTHANIAQIFDLGKVDGQYFIAMEYVHGRDLRAIFRHHQSRRKIIPVAQACYIGLKLCEGLDYAHNRKDYSGRELGLVHRDVSLNNLILSFDGELKIIDFGVAKAVGRSTKTETGFVKGKIAYMSPEQLCREPLDRRSDLFACGIVLFELLTCKRLFSVPSLRDLVQKVRNAEVPRLLEVNPDVPPELADIVHKALAKAAKDRFQSAGELHDALLELAQRKDFYVTRNQMASWMIDLYREHYEAESARIAALWERSKQIELGGPNDHSEESSEPSIEISGLDDGPTEQVPGTGGLLDPATKLGWEPPSSSPPPVGPLDLLDSIEAQTDVFRPESVTGTSQSPSRRKGSAKSLRLPLPSPERTGDNVPAERADEDPDDESPAKSPGFHRQHQAHALVGSAPVSATSSGRPVLLVLFLAALVIGGIVVAVSL